MTQQDISENVGNLLTSFEFDDYFDILDRLFVVTILALFAVNVLFFITFHDFVMVDNSEQIIQIVVFTLLVIYVFGMAFAGVSHLANIFNESRLYKDIRLAMINNQINNIEDIESIAENIINIRKHQIKKVVAELLSNAMTGKQGDLQDHIPTLKRLLKEYKEDTAFVDIPNALRLTLDGVSKKLGDSKETLYLSKQLQDIFTEERKRLRKQYAMTFVGLLVAIITAVYTLS